MKGLGQVAHFIESLRMDATLMAVNDDFLLICYN